MSLSAKKKLAVALIFIIGMIFVALTITNSRAKDKMVNYSLLSDSSEINFIPARPSNEKIIYTCTLSSEEIPAVAIAEVSNAKGNVEAIVARVNQGNGINLKIEGAQAVWEYKSISARSGGNSVNVHFDPLSEVSGYDWILTIKGEKVNFSQRVKDCQEVADE